jgi:hypothetical protein
VQFDSTLEQMRPEILKIAKRRQGLWFMETEDVYQWLVHELWRACQTFDPDKGDRNLTIKKYWWACWLNRRKKLLRQYYTQREQLYQIAMQGPQIEEDTVLVMDLLIPTCPHPGMLEQRVWRLIGMGYRPADIGDLLEIDPDVMQGIIVSFQTPEVRSALDMY